MELGWSIIVRLAGSEYGFLMISWGATDPERTEVAIFTIYLHTKIYLPALAYTRVAEC